MWDARRIARRRETSTADAVIDAGQDPGRVECGAMACSLPAQACCVTASSACIDRSANCNGDHYLCDDSADCNSGQICCWMFGIYYGSICGSGSCGSDPSQSVQRCKVSSECTNGGPCQTFTCAGGTLIKACSRPPFCT
jgi:hypothetical protein